MLVANHHKSFQQQHTKGCATLARGWTGLMRGRPVLLRSLALCSIMFSISTSSLVEASAAFIHPHLPTLVSPRSDSRRAFSSKNVLGNTSEQASDPQSSNHNQDKFSMDGRGNDLVSVHFKGQVFQGEKGNLLRSILLRNNLTPHNEGAQLINCRGLGTCGTCAVKIEGQVEPKAWTRMERARLNLPPHSPPTNQHLRLACQVRVTGDLEVTKFSGFWGQREEESEDKFISDLATAALCDARY